MKEFTIREIIEYAANIESESHKFYTDAAAKVTDPDTKQLAKELSEEETGHYNHLLDLLKPMRSTSLQILSTSLKLHLKERSTLKDSTQPTSPSQTSLKMSSKSLKTSKIRKSGIRIELKQ